MVKKVVIIFIGVVFCCFTATAGTELRCVVVDIGEGQAVILQIGNQGILIDVGHFGKGSTLLKTLADYGIEDIEKIFLTHLHPDHASGIFTVIDRFPRAKIYESGHRISFKPTMDSYRWVAEQLDSGLWDVVTTLQGDTHFWRGFTIDILWPRDPQGENLNHQSLVLKIAHGNSVILLMGDADVAVEKTLLNADLLPQNIDVVIIGHHGANDATSNPFLDKISPRKAVISVNRNNRRGYPASEVVERLNSAGTMIHNTAKHGNFEWNFSMSAKSTEP